MGVGVRVRIVDWDSISCIVELWFSFRIETRIRAGVMFGIRVRVRRVMIYSRDLFGISS